MPITETLYTEENYRLVVGTEGENKEFWEATPSGKIELGVINLAAALPFDLNREFYVDFTPAE